MEVNNATVREVITDYVSDSIATPLDIDIDDYLENSYDMDTLVTEMRDACEHEGVGPDELDSDVFVGLLEKYSIASECEIDVVLDDLSRRFGLGYKAFLTSDAKESKHEYKPVDSWFRAYLFIDEDDKYGAVLGSLQGRVSSLAEAFAKDYVTYDEMRNSEKRMHSFLATKNGVLDLTPTWKNFDDIDEPELTCIWYSAKGPERVQIPMVIVEDNR